MADCGHNSCNSDFLFIGAFGLFYWRYMQFFSKHSTEVIALTPEVRAVLKQLGAEDKFRPDDYPPLGYTGAESAEDKARATLAVNTVISIILAWPNGPVHAKDVSELIAAAMRSVSTLATEDRERTQGYMLETWYILGFKGATGRFAHGSAFPTPEGYGEQLPRGWKSPHELRPIGEVPVAK